MNPGFADATLGTVLAMPGLSYLSSTQQGRGGPQLVASPIYPLQPALALGTNVGRMSLGLLAALILAVLAFAYWVRGHRA